MCSVRKNENSYVLSKKIPVNRVLDTGILFKNIYIKKIKQGIKSGRKQFSSRAINVSIMQWVLQHSVLQ